MTEIWTNSVSWRHRTPDNLSFLCRMEGQCGKHFWMWLLTSPSSSDMPIWGKVVPPQKPDFSESQDSDTGSPCCAAGCKGRQVPGTLLSLSPHFLHVSVPICRDCSLPRYTYPSCCCVPWPSPCTSDFPCTTALLGARSPPLPHTHTCAHISFPDGNLSSMGTNPFAHLWVYPGHGSPPLTH